jgi:hypothetical protein
VTNGAPVGAYGLRIEGLDAGADLLHEAHDEWPVLAVDFDGGELSCVDVQLDLVGAGTLRMQREPTRASFALPGPADARQIVHPYLVPAAAIAGLWHGRQAFHAGGFVVGDGIWGVVGERESGKSTLLAGLHLGGTEVVSDDMLAIWHGTAYPGPRAIDLRAEAATALGLGEPLGTVGARDRWRVHLPAGARPRPFEGWIFLERGQVIEFATLAPSVRVGRLLQQRTLQTQGGDPAVLDLVAKPAVVLRHPERWTSVVDDGRALVELLASDQGP